MEETLHNIIEGWYIYDNALFEVCLTHELRENRHMSCPMRCGNGLIEYNPEILLKYTKGKIEELLKIECVRIVLKHPYQRQPADCSAIARAIASNIVIADNYDLSMTNLNGAKYYNLEPDKSYEWYAHRIENEAEMIYKFIQSSGTSSRKSHDELAQLSMLWQEDSFMENYLNTIIEKIERSNNWGSLPGQLVETIIASTKGRIDYRNVLSGFRASVMASTRRLTRMRPNRRTGFDNMGSLRGLATRLLVAVDISGSVSSESLSIFLTVVNKAFRYGIEVLDLVTFDAKIHDVMQLRKAKGKIEITGRGGTDYQPVIDYAVKQRYDGVLFLTDGYAPAPVIPPFCGLRVAWVIDTPENYNKTHTTFDPLGRCCVIDN